MEAIWIIVCVAALMSPIGWWSVFPALAGAALVYFLVEAFRDRRGGSARL